MKLTMDEKEAFAKDIAKKLIEYENEYDDSMVGHYLDQVITKYVSAKASVFVEMFEYILANQKEDYDTYGDIDTSVAKIKVTGLKEAREGVTETVTAMGLNDLFTGNYYIVVKVVHESTELKSIKANGIDYTKTYYHIRSVGKATRNTVSCSEYVRYGDCRDKGFITTYKKEWHDDEFRTGDYRGMDYSYWKFKQFMFALHHPYFELKEKEKK